MHRHLTKATELFREFTQKEQSSGIVLILATLISLLIANSVWGAAYHDFWLQKLSIGLGDWTFKLSLEHWVNDALMAVFFLLIGLEIEREIYIGELSEFKHALLPIFAAIGGMFIPALIHFGINQGTPTQSGFGIPMATDIAFALGALALLGSRVPLSLKIFVTALAIIDDLGAIILISVFYVDNFSLHYFGLSMGFFALLLILNRLGVKYLAFYLILGVVMWYFMLRSGVHATLAGVLLAFAIPFGNGDHDSPSYRLQHGLHLPVAFIIMPMFALANTGITLTGSWQDTLLNPNSLGIMAGLVLGKPIGILLLCWLAIRFKLTQLPDGVSWSHIIGAGCLAGIGFTMSIFISLLAFHDAQTVQSAKIAVLISSIVAATLGMAWLVLATPRTATDEPLRE